MRGGPWSNWQLLTTILVVAFLVRLACAIGVQRHLDVGSQEVCLIPGDADGYWELARRIAAGDDYEIYHPPRRVMRMPGFPFLLTLPRMAYGDQLLPARIWLAMIGTAACGFTYLLGKELCDAAVGLWAAAITAVSPVLSMFSVLLLSETAFAAAMTASLILLARLHHRLNQLPGKWESALAIAAGLFIAAATYIRPTWILVGPMAAVLLLRKDEFARRLRIGVLICLGLFAALLPWGVRNQAVTGHFTLTTFWVGPSLYDGLNPDATGDSNMTFFDRDNLLGEMSEYEMDREYRRRAWRYAWNHPGRTLALMGIKMSRYGTLWPNAAQFRQPWVQGIVALSFCLILVPALYGLWRMRRQWDLLLITCGPILYFAAIHMVFVGSIRYRLPAEYPLAVMSGAGVVEFLRCRRPPFHGTADK